MVVNFDSLKTTAGNNLNFLKELLDIFIEQYNEVLPIMERSLITNDYESLRGAVHKIKVSLKYLGMDDMYAKMQVLESDIAHNKNQESYEDIIKEFHKNCDIAINEIKEYINYK